MNGKVVLTDTIERIHVPNSHNVNVFFDDAFHLETLSADSSNVEIRIFRSHGLENDGIDLFVIKKI
ncbi:hypothetical protein [Niabella hibiscisoli]|uniref:hypothetical protein n=1 Tax=Niabella hibiscisoli TaxID=1825928 RepID=UPI001F0DD06F|nr:hypothetical protein [Niabella hibiscisoli]MCH5721253.1 hypothetical protein [Niabella hibiscisoli]